MTTLDDAVAAHMAHGAGACADPLTDSLATQLQPHQPPAKRQGWEDEVIAPRIPWAFYGLVVVSTVLVCALVSGCGGGREAHDDPTRTTQPVDCKATPELCK
jgi:hypothetical protein